MTYALDTDFYSNNDILFYDPSASSSSVCTVSGNTFGGTSGVSDYSSDQVKMFARESITSTWNISDSTVEAWFLQQRSVKNTEVKNGLVKGVIPRYGITSDNIGDITKVVEDAGVSPVFFYIYTVNEGGGLGGFINHFGTDDELDGAVANAKRDAEYLVKVTNSKDYEPAWQDLGTKSGNGDFVPQDVQKAGNADFKSMPLGTIGRVYIPATAAAAWEVYYPDGLKGSVNGVQNYGAPLQGVMNGITRMGGNPMDGGASISPGGCTQAVAGVGMTKAINWAIMIANNNGYGYDQNTRETGWVKWQADPSCTTSCGSFDCSSLVSAALTEAGYYATNPNFATDGEEGELEKAGFVKVNVSSFDTSADLQTGDILVSPGHHTEIYIGNNKTVGAHIDENGNISGGQTGDQGPDGNEISVETYKNHPWVSAWRATK